MIRNNSIISFLAFAPSSPLFSFPNHYWEKMSVNWSACTLHAPLLAAQKLYNIGISIWAEALMRGERLTGMHLDHTNRQSDCLDDHFDRLLGWSNGTGLAISIDHDPIS